MNYSPFCSEENARVACIEAARKEIEKLDVEIRTMQPGFSRSNLILESEQIRNFLDDMEGKMCRSLKLKS